MTKQEKLEQMVSAKLAVEDLNISSLWKDIERCLLKTVAPNVCLRTALKLRHHREKTIEDMMVREEQS